MDRAPLEYVLFSFLSSLVCVWFAAWALSRRRVKGAFEFFLFSMAAAIYSFGYGIELLGRTIEDLRRAAGFEYVGISFLATFWVFFAVKFTRDRPLGPFWTIILVAVSLLTLAAQITNEHHHLYYSSTYLLPGTAWPSWGAERGPLYLAALVWSQGLFIFGFALILRSGLRLGGRVRRQAFFMAGAITFPWLTSLVYASGIVPDGLDPTPFAMAATGVFLGLSLFRMGFLELVPAARELAIEGLRDGFMVFDGEFRLADANKAARDMLGALGLGANLPPGLPGAAEIRALLAKGQGESAFSFPAPGGGERRVEVHAYPIENGRGRRTGVSMTLRDITEIADLLARLTDLSSIDPLTSALNRRRFQELAGRDFGLAQRYARPIAVAILDLDHFKAVNDGYGHAAGDEVLRVTAERLMQGLRSTDLFARYGGEEFALLLPDTAEEGAGIVVERMRLALNSEPVAFAGRKIPVAASFGIFCAVPVADESLQLFLARADEALYVAKAEGRDTLRFWRDGALEELRGGEGGRDRGSGGPDRSGPVL